jgi:hypothetical protein
LFTQWNSFVPSWPAIVYDEARIRLCSRISSPSSTLGSTLRWSVSVYLQRRAAPACDAMPAPARRSGTYEYTRSDLDTASRSTECARAAVRAVHHCGRAGAAAHTRGELAGDLARDAEEGCTHPPALRHRSACVFV